MRQRQPDFRAARKAGARRHHADDHGCLAVHPDRASQDAAISSVTGRPRARSQDGDALGAAARVVLRECPTEDGLRAKQGERVFGNERAIEPFRRALVLCDHHRSAGERRQVDGLGCAAQILELGEGQSPVRDAVIEGGHVHDPVYAIDRQSTNRVRVEDREQHVVDTDTQCQDENSSQAVAPIPPQQAHREAHILRERVDNRQPTLISVGFLGLLDPSEGTACGNLRLGRRHSTGDVVGRELIEM